MESKGNVVVIGGGHHNTLGVVRAFGERGYGVDLVTIGGEREKYVSSSRYVKHHHALPNVNGLADFLLKREHKSEERKEVVVSCADSVTECLNNHRNSLALYYHLPGNNKQGEMIRLADKTNMISMASKCGLQAPTVWVMPEDLQEVSFPCITKSFVSSHGGKDDVRIFYDKESLVEFYETCKDKIFVQPFIEKKEEVQFIGCSLKGGEEIVIPGMTHILRSQPNTNTGFLEYGPIDSFYYETVTKSKQFIKECKYSGLFSIEFIRSKDEEVYFLEINFRNDGNAYCVTAAGVNLPVIWAKSCLGVDYNDELRDVKSIYVMPEFQDFKLVLQHKLSFGQWLRDVRRTDAFLDWNRKDKRPFFRFILNRI